MVSHAKLALVSDKGEAVEQLRKARAFVVDIMARGWERPQNQDDLRGIDEELRRHEDDAES